MVGLLLPTLCDLGALHVSQVLLQAGNREHHFLNMAGLVFIFISCLTACLMSSLVKRRGLTVHKWTLTQKVPGTHLQWHSDFQQRAASEGSFLLRLFSWFLLLLYCLLSFIFLFPLLSLITLSDVSPQLVINVYLNSFCTCTMQFYVSCS